MEPIQQKALNALEPFTLLASSANSPRAAVDLIVKATSATNTFVFAELLHTPNIQALRSADSDHAAYLSLLQLFSWGTWQEYQSTPNLPALNESQALKLRQLSLITLSSSPATLTYPALQTALELPNTRALEDLIISTIYAGLISAKLDTLAQRVDISSVAALRDLRPGSVPRMVAVLDDWDTRCTTVLAELESQAANVRRDALKIQKQEQANEKAFTNAMGNDFNGKGKAAAAAAGAASGGTGKVVGKRAVGEEGDEMDVDENGGTGGRVMRNAKRGGRVAFGKGPGRN